MKAFKTLSMALALILVTLTIPFGALAAIADGDVASIGDVGYADLTEALVAAQEGEEVVVLKDASINFATLGVLEKSITISAKEGLQTKPVITCTKTSDSCFQFTLAKGKTLTVNDLKFTSSSVVFGLRHDSTFNLNNVDVADTGYYCVGIQSESGGTINISGGIYTSDYSVVHFWQDCSNDSEVFLNISNGASLTQTKSYGGSYATISNCSGSGRPNVNIQISGTNTNLAVSNGSDAVIKSTGVNSNLTITGGTFTCNGGYSVLMYNGKSTVNVSGGNFVGNGGAWTFEVSGADSTVDISGGSFSSGTSHALLIKSNAAVNISGGTFTSGNVANTVNFNTTGKVTITGGTINGVNYGDGDDLFGNQYVQYKAEDAGTTDLRLLTNVTLADTGAYTEMGYFVSLSAKQILADTAKVVNTSKKVLYTSVKAGEAYIEAGEENVYWLAVELADIPEADYVTTIYVRPYAKTDAGTYVLGDMASFTVNAVVNPTVE